MIALTRLNGEAIMVNALQVETVEACPDTRVALMNGKQIYVRESPDQVRDLIRHWHRSLIAEPRHDTCEPREEDVGEVRLPPTREVG